MGCLMVFFSPAITFSDWGYWHAPEVFILRSGAKDVHVVQLGPEPTRGTKSSIQCQALAFYKNGEALKVYSRDDIFKIAPSLAAPASHYEILGQSHGFRRSESGRTVFDVEDYSGAILTFDVDTGELSHHE